MPYYPHPHPDFPEVDESTKLVRVMPKSYVQEMASTSTIYIPRPWQQQDELEGKLYPIERREILQRELRRGQAEVVQPVLDVSDFLADQFAVSCWREYDDQDDILWDAYGGDSAENKAIITTVGRLKKSMPEDLLFTIARVKYIDIQNQAFVGNTPDVRIFQKDKSRWDWEREIRLVVSQLQGGLFFLPAENPQGLRVPIDFPSLVTEVVDYEH